MNYHKQSKCHLTNQLEQQQPKVYMQWWTFKINVKNQNSGQNSFLISLYFWLYISR